MGFLNENSQKLTNMKTLIATFFLVFTFGLSNAQNDNPYAKFGYEGNTLETPQERLDYMLIIPNQDTLSTIKKVGIEPNKAKYYLIGKDDKILYQQAISKEQMARFLSVDPLAKDYPHNSTYAFAENDVIRSIDLEGLEKLIVSNINKEDRTANLTIKKTALIIKEGLNNIPQHGDFSSTALNTLFKKGNTNLYFKGLPQNGIKPTFINPPLFSGKKYRSENDVYKIKIVYDVNAKFVTADEASKLLISEPDLYSRVALGQERFFTNPKNPAKSTSNGNRNEIVFSPLYFGTSPTGPIGTVGDKTYPTANELLAHELGIHNMAGQQHPKDSQAKASEYNSPGLKGSVPNSIYPLKEETQQIINTNISNIQIKK